MIYFVKNTNLQVIYNFLNNIQFSSIKNRKIKIKLANFMLNKFFY